MPTISLELIGNLFSVIWPGTPPPVVAVEPQVNWIASRRRAIRVEDKAHSVRCAIFPFYSSRLSMIHSDSSWCATFFVWSNLSKIFVSRLNILCEITFIYVVKYLGTFTLLPLFCSASDSLLSSYQFIAFVLFVRISITTYSLFFLWTSYNLLLDHYLDCTLWGGLLHGAVSQWHISEDFRPSLCMSVLRLLVWTMFCDETVVGVVGRLSGDRLGFIISGTGSYVKLNGS